MVTCQVLQELGYGLTREIVSDVIYHSLKDHGWPSPFTDGVPGPDWWQGFMHRWPILAERNHNIFLHMSIDLIKRQTQIWIEMCGYFREVLKLSDASQRAEKQRHVELSCAGEMLTSDEVLEKIEKADDERAAKRKKRDKIINT